MSNESTLHIFHEYRRKHPTYRLGQAFCNFFNVKNPTLFHMRDDRRAQEMIEVYISDWQLT